MLLVRDTYLEKDLALKLLHEPPSGPEEIAQVEREFRLLARIEHAGIARAYDFGYLEGRPYFTSEFVPGETLAARSRVEDLPVFLGLGRRQLYRRCERLGISLRGERRKLTR